MFSCTSSSLVRGVPVKVNSRSSRDQPPGRIQNSNDLDEVFPDPTITQKGQLFSRTGYFLVIFPNGTIQATLNNSSIYSKKSIDERFLPGRILNENNRAVCPTSYESKTRFWHLLGCSSSNGPQREILLYF